MRSKKPDSTSQPHHSSNPLRFLSDNDNNISKGKESLHLQLSLFFSLLLLTAMPFTLLQMFD